MVFAGVAVLVAGAMAALAARQVARYKDASARVASLESRLHAADAEFRLRRWPRQPVGEPVAGNAADYAKRGVARMMDSVGPNPEAARLLLMGARTSVAWPVHSPLDDRATWNHRAEDGDVAVGWVEHRARAATALPPAECLRRMAQLLRVEQDAYAAQGRRQPRSRGVSYRQIFVCFSKAQDEARTIALAELAPILETQVPIGRSLDHDLMKAGSRLLRDTRLDVRGGLAPWQWSSVDKQLDLIDTLLTERRWIREADVSDGYQPMADALARFSRSLGNRLWLTRLSWAHLSWWQEANTLSNGRILLIALAGLDVFLREGVVPTSLPETFQDPFGDEPLLWERVDEHNVRIYSAARDGRIDRSLETDDVALVSFGDEPNLTFPRGRAFSRGQ